MPTLESTTPDVLVMVKLTFPSTGVGCAETAVKAHRSTASSARCMAPLRPARVAGANTARAAAVWVAPAGCAGAAAARGFGGRRGAACCGAASGGMRLRRPAAEVGPQQRAASARGRSAAGRKEESCGHGKLENTPRGNPVLACRTTGVRKAARCAFRRPGHHRPSIRAGAAASCRAGAVRGRRLGAGSTGLPVSRRGGSPRSAPRGIGGIGVPDAPLLSACWSHRAPPAARRRCAMATPAASAAAEGESRMSLPSAAQADAGAAPGASRCSAPRRTSQAADAQRLLHARSVAHAPPLVLRLLRPRPAERGAAQRSAAGRGARPRGAARRRRCVAASCGTGARKHGESRHQRRRQPGNA